MRIAKIHVDRCETNVPTQPTPEAGEARSNGTDGAQGWAAGNCLFTLSALGVSALFQVETVLFQRCFQILLYAYAHQRGK